MGKWVIKETKQINRDILEEQVLWSWWGVLNCPFWVSRYMERTGQMSAATPDPKHIPSFSFMTLTSDYLHFFLWQELRECSVEMY